MTAPNRDWIVGVGIEVRLTGGDPNGCRSIGSKDLVDDGFHGLPALVGLSLRHSHPRRCGKQKQPEEPTQTDLDEKTRYVRLLEVRLQVLVDRQKVSFC